jgi:hypothetical protein
MHVRIPDDKPRYFKGTPAEIVEKLACWPLTGFVGQHTATEYMERISEHVRGCVPAAPHIRWDSPDHFLLDCHVAGWLIIQRFDEPINHGVSV